MNHEKKKKIGLKREEYLYGGTPKKHKCVSEGKRKCVKKEGQSYTQSFQRNVENSGLLKKSLFKKKYLSTIMMVPRIKKLKKVSKKKLKVLTK